MGCIDFGTLTLVRSPGCIHLVAFTCLHSLGCNDLFAVFFTWFKKNEKSDSARFGDIRMEEHRCVVELLLN